MELKSIYDIFLLALQSLYSAEQQLLQALPRLARAASAKQLQDTIEEHINQTQTHVARLEQIFDHLGVTPRTEFCKGIQGILDESQDLIALEAKPEARDAALIGAIQKIEHYEVASYGCAKTYAGLLGEEASEELLEETLMEESDTDQTLTDLAETSINEEAMAS